MLREGKRMDRQRDAGAAHFCVNGGSVSDEISFHVAHGNWMTDRWTKTARRHLANGPAVGIDKSGAATDRLTAFWLETNAGALRTGGNCGAQGIRAVKGPAFAQRFGDRPHQ